jgi:hypothetical protein
MSDSVVPAEGFAIDNEGGIVRTGVADGTEGTRVKMPAQLN